MADFSDKNMLQLIDLERFPFDRVIPPDRKTLYRARRLSSRGLSLVPMIDPRLASCGRRVFSGQENTHDPAALDPTAGADLLDCLHGDFLFDGPGYGRDIRLFGEKIESPAVGMDFIFRDHPHRLIAVADMMERLELIGMCDIGQAAHRKSQARAKNNFDRPMCHGV
ncbi:hypothetical protein [Methylovirgula sp. HY1]|uniref:hypothetical protein n=1 Tax=Methylovirgula sp. HY1 TaxID=2822761 RepID=UPI001C5AFF5A|nr:hypothetical protein [Methylovirgula sp. HY1]